ncbi:MAG: hypothetical protein JW730_15585, partial [Anaerolineales bacterium]|nr:hypothetical protein [Anaerolineales bacterium]
MTKIIVSEDCGNSPKNIFIEKMTAAFAKRDAKFLLGNGTCLACESTRVRRVKRLEKTGGMTLVRES